MKDFFSKEQKEFALKKARSFLKWGYEDTEKVLSYYAQTGDYKNLEITMQRHQLYEYALLYQLTPEYKEIVMKRRNK